MLAAGQYAAAAQQLQRAIGHGHLPSRALMAWILLFGREGVADDHERAFALVDRVLCAHCKGVVAYCCLCGYGCKKNTTRSLKLARESSGKGSRYGHYALGLLYRYSVSGPVAQDFARALELYQLAASQNLDEAQNELGNMHHYAVGVARDDVEALRWQQLAAAQGHPNALYNLAMFHENGWGLSKSKTQAILGYRRALAAGYSAAAFDLQRLGA